MVHTCVGNPANEHLEWFQKCAKARRVPPGDDWWTTNSEAADGDTILFYLIAPRSCFVASARIVGLPKLQTKGRWKSHYMSRYKDVRMLPEPWASRAEVMAALPKWGWLTQPRHSSALDEATAKRLLRRVNGDQRRKRAQLAVIDEDRGAPARIHCKISRIVRDTPKARELKSVYDYNCQVCDRRIDLPNCASGYVEVHHLRPLGAKHRGRDNRDNMLVLCPNCHVEFDLLCIAIDAETGRLVRADGRGGVRVRFQSNHRLAAENIWYHWKRYNS